MGKSWVNVYCLNGPFSVVMDPRNMKTAAEIGTALCLFLRMLGYRNLAKSEVVLASLTLWHYLL
jgi:hypothetical protein